LWNPATQEFIPILREDNPSYRQNGAIITEAIRRWNGGTFSMTDPQTLVANPAPLTSGQRVALSAYVACC
jgi:hypothetical protein